MSTCMKSVLVDLMSIKVIWSRIQGTRAPLISAEGSSGPILIFLRKVVIGVGGRLARYAFHI